MAGLAMKAMVRATIDDLNALKFLVTNIPPNEDLRIKDFLLVIVES